MATLKSVIEYVDEIKPNAFSNEAKTQWVNECEGLVQTEVLLLADTELISYSYNTDKDKELLVKHPHVKIYWAYLTAMIDFANGEYNKYQNTMQMFNAFFSEYMRWFALWYHPADTHGENDGEDGWRGYYISAYGLAVKHGFEGTESEWLESLYGEEVMLRYDGTADELQWKYKSAEQWDSLMDTDALRGEIVSQTLSAAQSAREKAESAQTAAESAAQSAGTSAQSASGSASSASAAAQGASNDAALAASSAWAAAASETSSAQSAQTAIEKATAAQAAAQAAQSAKADAESAKAAAVTAGADAESANASAQSAKTAAQSAKTAAQAAQAKAETANTSAQTAKADAEAANTSAQSAKADAESAKSAAAGSAQSAGASAQSAQASGKLSESWAVGGTGTRTGEDTNNARYWSEQAQNAAGGGVSSFNGRSGAVAPQIGDYTAEMVGADAQGAATHDCIVLAGAMVQSMGRGEAPIQSRYDVYRRVLREELTGAELEALAHEHQIEMNRERCVLTFQILQTETETAFNMLEELVPRANGDLLVEMDRHTVVFLKCMENVEAFDELYQLAEAIEQTLLDEVGKSCVVGIVLNAILPGKRDVYMPNEENASSLGKF